MTYPLTDEQRRDRIKALQEQCDWLKRMAISHKQPMPQASKTLLEKYEQAQRELETLAQSAEAR